ncbi:Ras-related protein rsr1 [Recurvomyces mirabilis]|uniref:Ras-related protein rsr1 n=2 Tax=Recurvomyces mirabilis TaxID=574656 RepID=A0AAE0WSA4_9PEZI|nr:Ras-related protein rsr1 [Recurvomyces mirabilis]
MDTAGTEQFTSMREFYMRDAHGFLLVFSITSMSSLHELAELREQIVQIKGGDPQVPIVLVGNKSDLEEDRVVSRSKAFQVSQAWGNVPYYETSARRRQNVGEVFVDVCRQIIRKDMNARQRRQGGGGSGGGPSGMERYGGGDRSSRRKKKRRDYDDYNHRERRSRSSLDKTGSVLGYTMDQWIYVRYKWYAEMADFYKIEAWPWGEIAHPTHTKEHASGERR